MGIRKDHRRLFQQGKGKRHRVVIATKFFMNLFAGDPNGGGAGRKAIVAQCEESLRRLQTDYIDLYYIHNWDRFTSIEETMSALDDLVKAGNTRHGDTKKIRARLQRIDSAQYWPAASTIHRTVAAAGLV